MHLCDVYNYNYNIVIGEREADVLCVQVIYNGES